MTASWRPWASYRPRVGAASGLARGRVWGLAGELATGGPGAGGPALGVFRWAEAAHLGAGGVSQGRGAGWPWRPSPFDRGRGRSAPGFSPSSFAPLPKHPKTTPRATPQRAKAAIPVPAFDPELTSRFTADEEQCSELVTNIQANANCEQTRMDPVELCKFLCELNPENLIAFYKHFEIPEINMTARHLDSRGS